MTRSPLFNLNLCGRHIGIAGETDLAIVWSTGQAWRSQTRNMEGSQTPGDGTTRHITYVRVGGNRALFRN